MSGNVSKEGITADLEWMHRVGIGGMQMFDGDLGVARYIDARHLDDARMAGRVSSRWSRRGTSWLGNVDGRFGRVE